VKRGADLFNPESVKETIAKQGWSEGRKENAVDAYTSFLVMNGGTWQPPRYKRVERIPWIPTETEIDQLVAGCSFKVGAFLQLLKETGMRPGEALRLEWTDLDPVNGTVRVTPEKGSSPRIFRVSRGLMERLYSMPKDSQMVFGGVKLKSVEKRFQVQRRRIASKLRNPRLLRITFVTLRHWKATMEYHRTRDILHVMRILGHKNIKNTLVYTHLVDLKDEEYISKAAWTLEEARRLVEAGFEYVCEVEGARLFRKRR
jgi:integrase